MAEYYTNEIYRIEKLTKAYGQGSAYHEVVKDLDLTITGGEYLVVLGPSGSGKSSLLYLLAGLEKPSKGQIYIRGEDFSGFNNNKLASFHRLNVGIVYQNFFLLPSFTILENVAFPLALHGLRYKKRQERALEVLKKFNIDALADYYPSQISGGQQQKAAIARAMINTPPILLIDEPTGNLDLASTQEVMDILEMLHQQGHRTIVLVTHNPDFVKYATRTIHIIDGKVYHKVTDIPNEQAAPIISQVELMENIRSQKQDFHNNELIRNPFEK